MGLYSLDCACAARRYLNEMGTPRWPASTSQGQRTCLVPATAVGPPGPSDTSRSARMNSLHSFLCRRACSTSLKVRMISSPTVVVPFTSTNSFSPDLRASRSYGYVADVSSTTKPRVLQVVRCRRHGLPLDRQSEFRRGYEAHTSGPRRPRLHPSFGGLLDLPLKIVLLGSRPGHDPLQPEVRRLAPAMGHVLERPLIAESGIGELVLLPRVEDEELQASMPEDRFVFAA
jgi:hypothetical protein